MKNRKKAFSTVTCFLIFFISSISPIVFVSADNDDALAIVEGQSYTWTVEVLDQDKYYLAFDEYKYGETEGIKNKITVEYIYEDDDFWKIEIEIFTYKTYTDKRSNDFFYPGYFIIYKNGKDYVPGGFFIPKNAKEFLDDWDATANYSVNGLEITHEEGDIEREFIYQDNGILRTYTTKYKGDVIYKYVLEMVISFGPYFLGFMTIAIIGIILITIRKYRGGNKR